ncbi:MAG: MYXO-CTERM sorting domain-containing protein [Myxococcota bacterium]
MTRALHLTATACVTALCSWCSLHPSSAYAQSGPEDVVVITHGGTRSVTLVTVDDLGDTSNLTQFVLPEDRPSELIASVRALPDGSLLLAGVGDARVVRVLADGALRDTYVSPRRFPELTSAAIAGYASNGAPTQVLVTDASSSQAIVRDLRRGADIWTTSLSVPPQGSALGSQARIFQGAVLPGGRIALAAQLTTLDTWTVDIFTLAGADDPEMRQQLSSRPYPQQPPTTRVAPELERARDMTALDADTLLLASATSAFALKTDGSVAWTIDIADFLDVGGEIAAARKLDSGRIAVATFEPGVWTQAHPNHRVHWFELTEREEGVSAVTLIRSSTPLQRAPKALGALRSTGGTGTFRDSSGLGAPSGGGATTALEVSKELLLTPESASLGQRLTVNYEVTNTSQAPVGVTRFVVAALPNAACQEETPTRILAETNATTLAPLATFTLEASVFLDANSGYAPGTWCAYAAVQDNDGSWARLGDAVTFAITGAPTDILETEDLSLEEFDDSAPDPDDPEGDLDAVDLPEVSGCGCQQPVGRPTAPWSIALVLLAMGWMIARRRRRTQQQGVTGGAGAS